MAQDFANGQRHKRCAAQRYAQPPARSASRHFIGAASAPASRSASHSRWRVRCSRSGGAVDTTAVAAAPVAGDPAPVTRFEFFERLPNEKISARAGTDRCLDGSASRRWAARISVAGRVVHEQGRCRTAACDAGAIGMEHGDGDRHAVERGDATSGDRRDRSRRRRKRSVRSRNCANRTSTRWCSRANRPPVEFDCVRSPLCPIGSEQRRSIRWNSIEARRFSASGAATRSSSAATGRSRSARPS